MFPLPKRKLLIHFIIINNPINNSSFNYFLAFSNIISAHFSPIILEETFIFDVGILSIIELSTTLRFSVP